jgi:hypothetical protein
MRIAFRARPPARDGQPDTRERTAFEGSPHGCASGGKLAHFRAARPALRGSAITAFWMGSTRTWLRLPAARAGTSDSPRANSSITRFWCPVLLAPSTEH